MQNVASARVMEKCGFRCVGEQDEERFYALTVEEWRQIVQTEALGSH